MHFNFANILVIATLLSSIYLLLQKSDRMFPTVAVIASGVQALLAFGLMSLTLAKFRVDVILPALLTLAGAICWGKSSSKGATTAATIVTLVGAMELLLALRLFS
jgi:hypothetical protein